MHRWITEAIVTYVAQYKQRQTPLTSWKTPLVAFAAADDPLFAQLKEIVGPTHAGPRELLPEAKTVIAYFLPFEESNVASNRDGDSASRAWAVAYVETNALIDAINQHLAQVLTQRGYKAAILPPTHNFDEQQLISDWSHKHVAYIAGLGNFGLHHMLITEKGCCGRLGSLVTDLALAPTPRNQKSACLYYANGTCTACIQRCPVGALGEAPFREVAFDRHACYARCLDNANIHADVGLADVCGKCVSLVPCSFKNPVARLARP